MKKIFKKRFLQSVENRKKKLDPILDEEIKPVCNSTEEEILRSSPFLLSDTIRKARLHSE